MAEHGEIAGWMAAALAFLGALGAAMKFWNKPAPAPEKGNDMGALLQRVAKLEARADECDERENERHVWRDQVFARLLDLDKKTSAILAILDERKARR